MPTPGTTPDLWSIVYSDEDSPVTLPSFSLPQTLSQVRLVHASCRKADGRNADALRLLDKVIAAARIGATDTHFALYVLQAADVQPDATVPAGNAANVSPAVDGKNCFGALHGFLTDLLIDPAPKQLPGWGTQRSFVFLPVLIMYDGLGLPDPGTASQPGTFDFLIGRAGHDVNVLVILWLDLALILSPWSPLSFMWWLTSAIEVADKTGAKTWWEPIQTRASRPSALPWRPGPVRRHVVSPNPSGIKGGGR